METKNREKLLLICVGAAVGLLILNSLVFNPLSSSWTARQKEIADMRTKIANGKLLLDRAGDISSRWKSMSDNTLSPSLTLAESEMFGAFDRWGNTSGVVLASQNPESKDSDDDAYRNLEWRAEVTGTDSQIASFIYDVESSPLAMKVESVELSSRDDNGRQLALGLTVSGLILNPPTQSSQ